MFFNLHWACLKSCAGFGVGAWYLFTLSSHVFICFQMFFFCVVDQVRPPPSFGSWSDTLHLWLAVRPHGDPPPSMPIVGRGLHLMMSFEMFLGQLQEMQGFMSCRNKPTFFHRLFFNFFVNGSTLFYWLMAFANWPMSSLPAPFKQTWYHGQLFTCGVAMIVVA